MEVSALSDGPHAGVLQYITRMCITIVARSVGVKKNIRGGWRACFIDSRSVFGIMGVQSKPLLPTRPNR